MSKDWQTVVCGLVDSALRHSPSTRLNFVCLAVAQVVFSSSHR